VTKAIAKTDSLIRICFRGQLAILRFFLPRYRENAASRKKESKMLIYPNGSILRLENIQTRKVKIRSPNSLEME